MSAKAQAQRLMQEHAGDSPAEIARLLANGVRRGHLNQAHRWSDELPELKQLINEIARLEVRPMLGRTRIDALAAAHGAAPVDGADAAATSPNGSHWLDRLVSRVKLPMMPTGMLAGDGSAELPSASEGEATLSARMAQWTQATASGSVLAVQQTQVGPEFVQPLSASLSAASFSAASLTVAEAPAGDSQVMLAGFDAAHATAAQIVQGTLSAEGGEPGDWQHLKQSIDTHYIVKTQTMIATLLTDKPARAGESVLAPAAAADAGPASAIPPGQIRSFQAHLMHVERFIAGQVVKTHGEGEAALAEGLQKVLGALRGLTRYMSPTGVQAAGGDAGASLPGAVQSVLLRGLTMEVEVRTSTQVRAEMVQMREAGVQVAEYQMAQEGLTRLTLTIGAAQSTPDAAPVSLKSIQEEGGPRKTEGAPVAPTAPSQTATAPEAPQAQPADSAKAADDLLVAKAADDGDSDRLRLRHHGEARPAEIPFGQQADATQMTPLLHQMSAFFSVYGSQEAFRIGDPAQSFAPERLLLEYRPIEVVSPSAAAPSGEEPLDAEIIE